MLKHLIKLFEINSLLILTCLCIMWITNFTLHPLIFFVFKYLIAANDHISNVNSPPFTTLHCRNRQRIFNSKRKIIKMLNVEIKQFSRTSRITIANCAQLRASYLKMCSKIRESLLRLENVDEISSELFSFFCSTRYYITTHNIHYRLNLKNEKIQQILRW